MIALLEALSSNTPREEILFCAIGTGMNARKIPYKEAKDWGLIGWVKPMLSVMMDGMSDSGEYHMRQLLPDGGADAAQQRYFRVDIRLEDALDDLDAAHRANINALLREADRIIQNQETELNHLVELLTA